MKYLDQGCDRHGIVRPIGNLLDRVFGTELFDLRPYYLCQSSSYLLRQVSLVRGKSSRMNATIRPNLLVYCRDAATRPKVINKTTTPR